MEVYIEYLIIDNFIINFLLLFCVIKSLCFKASASRLVLSSLFGTIVVCLFPFVKLPQVLLLLSKICVGVIMVLLAYNFASLKQFLIGFTLFIIYTFLLGGACYGIIKLLNGDPENFFVGSYDTVVPVSIIITICFVYSFIILRLTKYIYRKKDMLPFISDVELTIGDKTLLLKAFTDSGNRLYDNSVGSPVIILSAFSLERYYSEDQMVALVFGEKNKYFKNIHYLHYGTIEGVSKKMVVFEADKLVIKSGDREKVTENVCVGVTFKKFNDAISYDVLLHPSFM